jgi:uncharacterized 2Fe-2S/4Fe-4S cluster protein (DUF4445 family)
MPIKPEERQRLSPADLDAGWRMACLARADGHMTIELAQWEAPILTDDSHFEFKPGKGFGAAIDLGTTTIVAQLVDLSTGGVVSVVTALNEQARHGADIMSRVEYAVTNKGQKTLERIVRRQISDLLIRLIGQGKTVEMTRVVLVGNTVMHHLFCGIDVEPLSQYPFEPARRDSSSRNFSCGDLEWELPGNPEIQFMPCAGGFGGSDVLAGIVATRMHESKELLALMDLGTNGEIVVGTRQRMLCASTAAGPAFEGARISMGMRAATGAISEISVEQGKMRCHVIGHGPARGICGSGLVDAVAVGLELGSVRPNGRIAAGESLPLYEGVSLTQWDIRELQMAKGAIAAGLRILLQEYGASLEDLQAVYLAGAFGNYVKTASARRIGLIKVVDEKIRPSGNTALLGAKLALFSSEETEPYQDLLPRITHISLNESIAFQDIYAEEMLFPSGDGSLSG